MSTDEKKKTSTMPPGIAAQIIGGNSGGNAVAPAIALAGARGGGCRMAIGTARDQRGRLEREQRKAEQRTRRQIDKP
jgi:hypothetical protein